MYVCLFVYLFVLCKKKCIYYADERTVDCKVYPSQTILDIKKILQAGDDGCSPDTLSCDGIQLDDCLMVSEFGIGNEDTLHGINGINFKM